MNRVPLFTHMRKSVSVGFLVIFVFFTPRLFSSQDTLRSTGTGLYPLPKINWNPETRLVIGAMLLYVHQNTGRSLPSQTSAEIHCSQNRHVMTSFSLVEYFGLHLLKSTISFSRFPKTFYGVGSLTPKKNAEKITPQSIGLMINWNYNIYSNWFIGGIYRASYDKLVKSENGGIFDTTVIIGEKPTFLTGLGGTVHWDTRNNPLYPTSGAYHQFTVIPFIKNLGSRYGFVRTTLDLRKYITLNNRFTLTTQFYLNIMQGQVPFYAMSTFGGYNISRGYYPGRYRDYNMIAFQTELRSHLIGRVGATVFGGYGNVFRHAREIDDHPLKHTIGAGLRINISKKETTNIRIDFAFGQQSFYPVLSIGEAF